MFGQQKMLSVRCSCADVKFMLAVINCNPSFVSLSQSEESYKVDYSKNASKIRPLDVFESPTKAINDDNPPDKSRDDGIFKRYLWIYVDPSILITNDFENSIWYYRGCRSEMFLTLTPMLMLVALKRSFENILNSTLQWWFWLKTTIGELRSEYFLTGAPWIVDTRNNERLFFLKFKLRFGMTNISDTHQNRIGAQDRHYVGPYCALEQIVTSLSGLVISNSWSSVVSYIQNVCWLIHIDDKYVL